MKNKHHKFVTKALLAIFVIASINILVNIFVFDLNTVFTEENSKVDEKQNQTIDTDDSVGYFEIKACLENHNSSLQNQSVVSECKNKAKVK